MFQKKTKADIVDSVYHNLSENLSNYHVSKLDKTVVKGVVDGVLDELKRALVEGNPIELRGFGIFEFRYRKPKLNAHNPKTGEKVKVSGHSVVAFRSGSELKDAVWDTEYGKE